MNFIDQEKYLDIKLELSTKEDKLIFEEKSKAFTVGISLSSDEKYFFITTSDHNTSEQYYFSVDEELPKPKLIKKRKRGHYLFH